jgi:hypothetical protein
MTDTKSAYKAGENLGEDVKFAFDRVNKLERELAAAEAKCEGMEKALQELVALKELKKTFETERGSPYLQRTHQVDYERRKPLAWEAARAAIDAQKEKT